jgi:hypothetical protein
MGARDAAAYIPAFPNGRIGLEIMRRLDLAGDELPSSLEAFLERHLGPETSAHVAAGLVGGVPGGFFIRPLPRQSSHLAG